jgi:hypothetical protein
MPTTDELWEKIFEQIGSDLRGGIEYNGVEYESVLREDLQKQYSDSEIQRIVNESIVLQLGVSDRPSGLKTGELNAFMRMYEQAWILSCPHPNKRKGGILVSIDQDRETATLPDIEQCMETLEKTVATDSE